MNYMLIFILCALALIVGILNLIENELLSTTQKRYFIIVAVIIIFEITIDTIAFYIDGKFTNYTIVHKTLKIVEFIVTPFIPAIFAKIISSKVFWNKIRVHFGTVIVLNTIAQIITFFKPLMFRISDEAIYSRTKFGFMYLVFLTISIILLGVSSKNTFIQRTEKLSITLLSIFLFIASSVVIRIYMPQYNVDWLCITFCYFIFILYFNNKYLSIDSTTSLLNRKAFDTKMEKINYTTAIIIIDANEFKTINDNYGHRYGDIAIAKIAEAIFHTYNKVGLCYRIGGDEFCVVLKEGIIKENTSETAIYKDYEKLEKLSNELNVRLYKMSKKWKFLKRGVAQGYEIYFSDVNCYGDKLTIEEVFNLADRKMYKNKNKRPKF